MEGINKIMDTWISNRARTDYFDWKRTSDELLAAAKKWDARAEQGQVVTFELAEGLPSSEKALAQSGSVFWTGYITTVEGDCYKFVRLDSRQILNFAQDVGLSWRKITYSRKSQQREYKFKGVIGRSYTERSLKAQEMSEELEFPEWLKIETIQAVKKDYFDYVVQKLKDADSAAEKAQTPMSKLKLKTQRLAEVYKNALLQLGKTETEAEAEVQALLDKN